MTELLTRRPAPTATPAPTAVARQSTTMTCDVPVVQATCRPTGRRPRTVASATPACPTSSVRTRSDGGASTRARPNSRARSTVAVRPTGARCSTTVRRRWAAGVLIGAALAGLVAVLGMVGSDYEKSVSGVPSQTEVVHVRSGESLSSLAERIAPELPAAAVIATVRDLNDLRATGLRPGQALLVPAYR